MHSFECALEFVQDAGVEFVLRIATRFPAGETAKGRTDDAPKLPRDPFAEPERALIVRELTPTHRALLNKFSVLREHLLIVTREHEDQRELLNARDFEALALCMRDAEVLAFYNGGTEAGASQSHKHLQVVTLPLSPRHSVPIDALLNDRSDALPFRHAALRLEPGQVSDPAAMLSAYTALHRRAGLAKPQPYNLLVTHEFMLVVRDLTPTHRALLNKFSVLREHLLIVTKKHEDQRELLNARDFEALALCMADAEVLAFYNGGTEAGASQSHKHLQVVTLPLSPRHSVPMDALLSEKSDALPFRHAAARLAPGQVARPEAMLETYRELHGRAGLEAPRPYNLLVTHEFMLVVPRARDRFEGISINSLAFAGSFFVRDAKHAHVIAAAKPMSVLKSVAMP